VFFIPQAVPPSSSPNATMTVVSKDSATDANEPLTYLATPSPVVTSAVFSIPPAGKTEWMTHPAPGYIYVLQGTLTVEFEDGKRIEFKQGQAFLQARTKWHRGLNTGAIPVRFLAVFYGAKGIPNVMHPPIGDPDLKSK
jgi:quercetin dioxygenase-like cupin family protein